MAVMSKAVQGAMRIVQRVLLPEGILPGDELDDSNRLAETDTLSSPSPTVVEHTQFFLLELVQSARG